PLVVPTPGTASAKAAPEPEPEPPITFVPQEPAVTAQPEIIKETVAVEKQGDVPPVPDDAADATSPEAKEMIEEALRLRDANKIIPARELLNNTLNMQLSAAFRSEVKTQLSKLAQTWLLGRTVLEGDKLTSYYQVQSGDNFERIAKKYQVPYDILMQINGIARPQLLQAGRKIKVIHGPFNAVVYKSSFTMDLYLQNKYVKTYRVGLGTVEHETPSGRWRVKSDGKLIKPTWTDPDTGKTYVGDSPDYPLGSRWIAIEGIDDATRPRTGFAIHGTKDPESIGARSSRGCIRLYNGDVLEAYNLLYAGISEVLVKD
ncbi:MAG: L,D-transpeptidase family protein, partial [Planctomycetota bacterium]